MDTVGTGSASQFRLYERQLGWKPPYPRRGRRPSVSGTPFIKKTERGPLARFLSVFLAFGGLTPWFLKLSTVVNTPLPTRRRAVRRGHHVGRVGDNKINFFIYYEVDGDTSKHHLSASNYGPENEWVLLTHAQ